MFFNSKTVQMTLNSFKTFHGLEILCYLKGQFCPRGHQYQFTILRGDFKLIREKLHFKGGAKKVGRNNVVDYIFTFKQNMNAAYIP